MKNLRIYFLIVITGFCFSLKAQWSGTGPVFTFDDVGIGKSNPQVKLDVGGEIRISDFTPRFELYDNNEDRLEGDFIAFSDDILLRSFRGDLHFATGINGFAGTRMTIDGLAGNVGIGTDSPAERLHIIGSTIISQDLEIGSQIFLGSVAVIEKSLNTLEIYGQSGLKLGIRDFATSSTSDIVHLTSNNRVGIGTNNPSQILDVNGAIALGNTTINTNGTIRFTGSNFQGFRSGTWHNLDEQGLWGRNGTSAHYLSGMVGVGTTTPAVQLDVHGSGIIRSSGSTPRIQLFDDGAGENRIEGELRENSDNIILSTFRGDLRFDTGTTGTASPRLTIRGLSGNVGIGTSTPGQKLEVDGAVEIGNTSTNSSGTIRYNGTNFQGHHNGIWRNLDNSGSAPVWSLSGTTTFYDNGRVGIGINNPSAELHIKTLPGQNGMNIDIDNQRAMHVSGNRGVTIGNAAAPPSEGLAVTGNAGIGTNSPSQKLEVVGAIKLGTTASNINGSIRYDGTNFQGHTAGSWVNLNGSSAGGSVWNQTGADVYYNSGNVGIGTNNPAHLLHVEGDVAVAGFIIGPSDRRLKKDIQPIHDALTIVSALQPKSYSYKSEQIEAHGLSDGLQYGLIAQELEDILPSLISDNALVDDDGTSYKGIVYDQLIPILTQAIKELNQDKLKFENMIRELQQENEALKSTTRAFSSRLDQLELLMVKN